MTGSRAAAAAPGTAPAAEVRVETALVGADGLLRVEGWAVPAERVQVFLGHRFLGLAELGIARADVGLIRPDERGAAWSGFRLIIDVGNEDLSGQTVHARALLPGGDAIRASAALDITALGQHGHGDRGMWHPTQPPSEDIQVACEHAVRLQAEDPGLWSISGWAFAGSAIAEVAVMLDGCEQAASIGLDRPDIGNRFPRSPGARRSGFAFRGRLGAAPRGDDLRIRVRAADGSERLLRHRLTPAADPPIGRRGVGRDVANRIKFFLDSPIVFDGTVTHRAGLALPVHGWAIARDGIPRVSVSLDGAELETATHGLHRPEIGVAFADWPDSARSGFALTIPGHRLARGRIGLQRRIRVVVRDPAGAEAASEFTLKIVAEPPPTTILRGRVRQAEADLNAAILRGAAARFGVVVRLAGSGKTELRRARRTLMSLRAQAYANWHAQILLPRDAQAEAAASLLQGSPGASVATATSDRLRLPHATHLLVLRAGDILGCDALMEFAVEASLPPHADFLYADELRADPTDGTAAPDFRPQWSPDLLLSANYIGNAWCAEANLIETAGVTGSDLYRHCGYDLVLRLTERARHIGHVPKLLCDTTGFPGEADPAAERAALVRALERRGIDAVVEAGLAPGLHRVRRPAALPGRSVPTVSIVLPTCGKNGLFRTAIESLRGQRGDIPIELVAIDNIPADQSADKAWLRDHADIVVAQPARFNWSRFNNAGARAASGDLLLFVNDDVEARNAGWLSAMVEQALRPEIGAVGARLLYPDGRLQHAGISLSSTRGLHPFRFTSAGEAGPFGRAVSLREVSAVTGACLMVRRAVFEQVGGFDEAHAIINNDLDFCLRLRAAGWRVVCTPHAELMHHELASRIGLGEDHDRARFDAACGPALRRGDPYHNPNLARDSEMAVPEPEPVQVMVAGHPLLAASRVRRILAVKLDHIGDFVTGFAALRRLKQRFPAARLEVLCGAAAAALAHLEPAINEVIEFAVFHPRSADGKRRIGAGETAALAAQLSARLDGARYDLVIDLRKHPETRPLLRVIGGRLLAGFDRDGEFPWLDVAVSWDGDAPATSKRTHAADDLLRLVEAVAVACEPRPRAAQTEGAATPYLPPRAPGRLRVCVHPGAGSKLKQWPPEHFAALMDLMAEQQEVEFVLIGGDGDRRIAERVLARTKARARSLVGEVALAALPGVLQDCDLFVGNDSGPKHLAGALGVPTVGVHSGVVDPAEWAASGEHAVAVYRRMACSPCYLTKLRACPRDLACLRQLQPADVAAVCRRITRLSRVSPTA